MRDARDRGSTGSSVEFRVSRIYPLPTSRVCFCAGDSGIAAKHPVYPAWPDFVVAYRPSSWMIHYLRTGHR